ncbi:MAG: helicase RepA family protein [Shewanella xiamenensis]|jgi:hypothetical protein|uniref:AAA family ATPase n=2 Tax=Shewanella TaxID=22 RepID=A0AAE4Q3A7_9GAMM|nr:MULTISPECIES: AAA family ATPase [Shewanella]MCD8549882.1 helicase RepA family protein [Shewanella xiamenensis]MCD8558233.1 helicase RepA family protein [Shewanella xiamenensis]MCK7657687.1 helicase RepA family protein [Shewanella sp. JNE4-2]MCT8858103.1 helicase RepA family protein [Shewanella xiamenensis]MDH0451007.1 helicase RepA family protein [Shewanella sp. GD04112]
MQNLNLLTVGEVLQGGVVQPPEFVLAGLLKAHVGMLIATPSVGKSHLAMSIGMELASDAVLVGLSSSAEAKKVLYFSSEDDLTVLKQRLGDKLQALPQNISDQVSSNLFIVSSHEPLCSPPEAGSVESNESKSNADNLIQLIKNNGIELVIVDTVSEVIGRCDEVKHDRLIKHTFQQIASESGAAVLLVHHVNKDEIRGSQKISMASGAGLSSVMRLVKFMVTLQQAENGLEIRYLKDNYIPSGATKIIPVEFSGALLVSPSKVNFERVVQHQAPQLPDSATAQPARKATRGKLSDRKARKIEDGAGSLVINSTHESNSIDPAASKRMREAF